MKDFVISPIWKNIDFDGVRKKRVRKLMSNIFNEIPQNNKSLRRKFYSIMDSFFYKAPETISETIYEVFEFLKKYIATIKKDEQWIDNIRALWIGMNENLKFELI